MKVEYLRKIWHIYVRSRPNVEFPEVGVHVERIANQVIYVPDSLRDRRDEKKECTFGYVDFLRLRDKYKHREYGRVGPLSHGGARLFEADTSPVSRRIVYVAGDAHLDRAKEKHRHLCRTKLGA